MNRRRRHKKIGQQDGKIIPVLIEGEDYSIIFILLVMAIVALFALFSPKYVFVGVSFVFFLFAVWQFYSGIALTMLGWDKRLVAKYKQDREPSLFYLNIIVCFCIGLFTFVMSLAMIVSPTR